MQEEDIRRRQKGRVIRAKGTNRCPVLPTEIVNMKPHIFRNAIFDQIFVFILVCTHVNGVTFVGSEVEYHDGWMDGWMYCALFSYDRRMLWYVLLVHCRC